MKKVKCENCLQCENVETSHYSEDGYWICESCMEIAMKEASLYKS